MTSLSKTEQTGNTNTPEPEKRQLLPMHTMKFRIRTRVERIHPDGKVEQIATTIHFEYEPNQLIQKVIVDFFRSEEVRMGIFFLTFIAIVMVGGNKL
jgi:hypothetical protein